MEYIVENGGVRFKCTDDFDPVKIFECGQCFRWNADESGVYKGVAMGKAAKVKLDDDGITITCSEDDFNNVWYDYFDLDRNYAKIREMLCTDDYMREATKFGAGIRILKQDRWEALCSFIISQCNNIPRIKKIVETLCRLYGDEVLLDGETLYTFPTAERIAALEAEDLAPLRSGYRAPYIINAARAVADGSLKLEELAELPLKDAKKALMSLNGVGEKVANCAILFSLRMIDAFPVDVWMKRAIAEHYPDGLDPTIFGGCAGIAQQYMFYYQRSGN